MERKAMGEENFKIYKQFRIFRREMTKTQKQTYFVVFQTFNIELTLLRFRYLFLLTYLSVKNGLPKEIFSTIFS